MPRPIHEQVVVITGASSGIGRAAAHLFAQKGAAVVIAGRNEEALHHLTNELERTYNARTHAVVTDVSIWHDVANLCKEAAKTFDRIDTWVNNAGISQYGTVEESAVEELERVFQVTLMSQVYGMKAVIPFMRANKGGTIINVGSMVSQRSVPLQAAYSASKHGVKGFTDSVRMELKHERANIDVVLIMPGAINTPFYEHARSKMGVRPVPPPPVYPPEIVAEAIVYAAQHPKRDIYVGGSSKLFAVMEHISPRFTDWFMLQNGSMFKMQKGNVPDHGEDELFEPEHDRGSIEGDFNYKTKPDSFYTRHFELYNGWQRLLLPFALIGAAAALLRSRFQPEPEPTTFQRFTEGFGDQIERLADRVTDSVENLRR